MDSRDRVPVPSGRLRSGNLCTALTRTFGICSVYRKIHHIGLSACDMSRARAAAIYCICVSRLAAFSAVFAFLHRKCGTTSRPTYPINCVRFDNTTSPAQFTVPFTQFLPTTRTNASFKTRCLYQIAMGIFDDPQGVGALVQAMPFRGVYQFPVWGCLLPSGSVRTTCVLSTACTFTPGLYWPLRDVLSSNQVDKTRGRGERPHRVSI